jgi:ketosteroid isomerase-like protein
MDRASAQTLLGRLHEAQNHFYGGGHSTGLRGVLTPDVTWTIPGRNAISGTYRGLDEVLDYFSRRRAIANSTFRLHRRDVLVGAGTTIAALTDGTATIAGQPRTWSTVGLYEVRGGRVAACWLLPLDAVQFDEIWA